MSLKFVFNPPRHVRLLRWQKISFIASKPFLHFCLKEREEKKQTTVQMPTLKSHSLAAIYKYLNDLRNTSAFDEVFSIKDAEYSPKDGIDDLSKIMEKLQNGLYQSTQEVKNAIDSFLQFVYQNFLLPKDGRYRDAAYKAINEFADQFARTADSSGISSKPFLKSLKEFTDLPTLETNENVEKIYDAKKISDFLNDLDKPMKQKAEWIIRSKCPRVPYYMRYVDIAKLPYNAIDALIDYFNIKL
jgi:hypothetical protein